MSRTGATGAALARSYSTAANVHHHRHHHKSHSQSSLLGHPKTSNILGRSTTSKWCGASKQSITKCVRDSRGLEASRKLAHGQPEDLTLAEVEELFESLHATDKYLEVDVLIFLLRDLYGSSEEEIEPVRLLLEEESDDGCINTEDFLEEATDGPCRDLIVELHQNSRTLKDGEALGVPVDRELLEHLVGWRVERDEALATLPMTLCYMIVFICLVVFHLQVWKRQQIERGVQFWISGYGQTVDGPYLKGHVADVDGFFAWLNASGLPSILGDVENATQGLTAQFAVGTTLIGDIQLQQRHADHSQRSTWLLSTALAAGGASAALVQSGDFLGAARESCRKFREEGWLDRQTEDWELKFSGYDGTNKFFSLTTVTLLVRAFGRVHASVTTTAVPFVPYPSAWSYPLDAVYLLLILYMMCKELWEMYLIGIRNLRSYWSFWNVVDWTSIILGLVNSGLWMSVCFSMHADALINLMEGGDSNGRMEPNLTELSESQLEAIMKSLVLMRRLFFVLHILVALNAASIILRFFKAFRANPRLNTVEETLRGCSQDIVHFLIVFLVMFICMAVIGHVLFGSDVKEFHSIASSLNTCWMVLMGDFGWYVDMPDSMPLLPSGIPYPFMVIWYFMYMFFVSIVLMNMLLAIILDKYSDVGNRILAENPHTLWVQAGHFLDRMRHRENYMPLQRMRSKLQDPRYTAHLDRAVTAGTLKQNFHMSDLQANTLMDWLQTESFLQETSERDPQDVSRMKRTERLLKSMSEQFEGVKQKASQCDKRLEAMERRMGIPPQDQTRQPHPTTNTKSASSSFLWCSAEREDSGLQVTELQMSLQNSERVNERGERRP